jgi:hypothetical protein
LEAAVFLVAVFLVAAALVVDAFLVAEALDVLALEAGLPEVEVGLTEAAFEAGLGSDAAAVDMARLVDVDVDQVSIKCCGGGKNGDAEGCVVTPSYSNALRPHMIKQPSTRDRRVSPVIRARTNDQQAEFEFTFRL